MTATLGAAAVVWLLPPIPAATVLAAALGIALVVEVIRLSNARARAAFGAALAPMLRPQEHQRVTGATTLAFGFTIAALVVPGTAAAAGILMAGIGDAAGAVVGRRWGSIRYPGGKSLQGSATFLAVSLMAALLLGLGLLPAVALAVGLTALEALSLPLDDNLYLPLAAAVGFSLLAG